MSCARFYRVAGLERANVEVTRRRLLATPAIIFNRKDGLQDAFLAQHFALSAP